MTSEKVIHEKVYLLPSTADEAIALASKFAARSGESGNSFRFLAGGTDVMPNRFQGNDTTVHLIDLTRLHELRSITMVTTSSEDRYLRIGALETLEDTARNPLVREEFPMLAEAALSVASPLIRTSATIGGNILCENRCLFYNQSEWWRASVGYCLKCDGDICIATGGKKACFSELVSDTAPALIALDADIEWQDMMGVRRQKLEEIYTGDGATPRNLPQTALVLAIYLPLGRRFKTAFFKLRERESLDFTSLTSAVSLDATGNLKVSLAGVDPKPVVVTGHITDNKDDLIKQALRQSRAIDNDMYSRTYRREMIRVYLTKSFDKLTVYTNGYTQPI